MADYQRNVDEIRSFIQARDHAVTEAVREMSTSYVSACNEVNQRLRRCSEFLQQGLHSEAVHLAQAEPSLLDCVAVLDFPERLKWVSLSSNLGLAPVPLLQLEGAKALNEAYAHLEPLENLLREHRLLALARAPISARLSVMRKIAELDAGNQVWEQDIKEFEKARLREISNDVANAVSRNDTGVLDSYWDEVANTSWRVGPPSNLLAQVNHYAKQSRQNRVRTILQKLQHEMHDAFTALDVERGRWLRDRWNDEVKHADVPLDDPLWDRISPALEWLDRQERREEQDQVFQQALTSLEKALAHTDDVQELESLYFTALKFKKGIPEAMEERYRRRLRDLRRASRWRDRLVLAATFSLGAILLVGFLSYMIYRAGRARNVAQALETLQQMADNGRYEDAHGYLAHLAQTDPAAAKSSEVRDFQLRIEERTKESQRRTAFEDAFKEAEAAPPDENSGPIVAKAQALAQRPEERTAVQRLVQQRQQASAEQRRQKRDEAFMGRANKLAVRVRQIEQLAARPADASKAEEMLDPLINELAQLRKEADDVGENGRALLKSLRDRLEKVQQTLAQPKEDPDAKPPG